MIHCYYLCIFKLFEGRQIKTNQDHKSPSVTNKIATSSKPATVQTTPSKSISDSTRDVSRQQLSMNDDASLWDTYLNQESDNSAPSTPLSKLVTKTALKAHKSSPTTSSKQSIDIVIGNKEKKDDGIKRSDQKVHPQRTISSHSKRRKKSGDASSHKRNISDGSFDGVEEINQMPAQVKSTDVANVVEDQEISTLDKTNDLQSHQDHIDHASSPSSSSHQFDDQDNVNQLESNHSNHNQQQLESDDQVQQFQDEDSHASITTTDVDHVKEEQIFMEIPSSSIQQDEQFPLNSNDIKLTTQSNSSTQITDDIPIDIESNSDTIVQHQDIQTLPSSDDQEIDNHNKSSDDIPPNQIVQEIQTGSKNSKYVPTVFNLS